jgi:hypothetical protein
MAGIPSNNYTLIATSYITGLQVATGPTTLERVVVNTTSAWTVGFIDGTSGTTVNVGQLKSSIAEGTYFYNLRLASGLRVVTSATGMVDSTSAGNITIAWRQ